MKVKEIYKNIFHVEANSQYELTSTFLRPQEFYESPFKDIRGKVFSLEYFMDRYAKEYGNFTYTTDWSGFNIPDYSLRAFFASFSELYDELLIKEIKLKTLLQNSLKSNDSFYVIGTFKSDHPSTIDHELAHAFYYLNPEYKIKVDSVLAVMAAKYPKVYAHMRKKMKDVGYGKNVIDDEIQAHLAVETPKYLKSELDIIAPPFIRKELKKIFKDTKISMKRK